MPLPRAGSRRRLAGLCAAIVLGACAAAPSDAGGAPTPPSDAGGAPTPPGSTWPDPPTVPTGSLEAQVAAALDRLVTRYAEGALDRESLEVVAGTGDARLGWILSDMLRFAAPGTSMESALGDAFIALTGVDPLEDERFGQDRWLAVTNLLIGWDLPAPPGYREQKAAIFLPIEPGWEPFFADADSAIDWRWVSWGGVFIDDRLVGDAGRARAAASLRSTTRRSRRRRRGAGISNAARVRHRRQRRGGGVPEAHHGGPRDGQPDGRRTTCRDAVLHALRLGAGLPHRCGTGRDRDAHAANRRAPVKVEQGDVRPHHRIGVQYVHRRGRFGSAARCRVRPRANDDGGHDLG